MVVAVLFAGWTQAAPTAFGTFPNNATHSNAAVALAISNVPTNAGVVYDAIGRTNSIQVYNFNSLVYTGPIDVSLTLARIRSGGCITAESNDGGFFNFNPGELPNIPRKGNNYYMEFVVWFSINTNNATYDPSVKPFGVVSFPGPMRLLIGLGGEVYFTGDHYGSGLETNAYYVTPAPDPSTFHISSIAPSTNDMRINWQTVGGSSNVVQATSGAPDGSYSNNFTDISTIIVPTGGDLNSTNYLDIGGATNTPSRYYRVRLVP
jgi:guanyl-specific ribonuclease Sa